MLLWCRFWNCTITAYFSGRVGASSAPGHQPPTPGIAAVTLSASLHEGNVPSYGSLIADTRSVKDEEDCESYVPGSKYKRTMNVAHKLAHSMWHRQKRHLPLPMK